MSRLANTHSTLIETLWQGEKTIVGNVLLVIAGSIALWVSAKIQVPFYPVPMSMQALVVLVIGIAIIFAFSVAWLGSIIGWEKPILQFGLYPFLPGAVFKFALAATVLPFVWKRLSKRNE